MIMNYPENNNAVSRVGCPRLATSAAFAEYDVFLPVDCVSGGIESAPMPENKPASEPMVESFEPLSIPRWHNEPARRLDTSSAKFFSLRD